MTVITLDYDDVVLKRVYEDCMQLLMCRGEADDTLTIKQSSPNHYHAVFVFKRIIPFPQALEDARRTGCSKEYLDRVEKVGYFCIRTSRKSDGTPEPKLALMVIKGEV